MGRVWSRKRNQRSGRFSEEHETQDDPCKPFKQKDPPYLRKMRVQRAESHCVRFLGEWEFNRLILSSSPATIFSQQGLSQAFGPLQRLGQLSGSGPRRRVFKARG